MNNYYELNARYDSKATKSTFYGKAHIKETATYRTLVSYDTEILKQNLTSGEISWLCKDKTAFSQTTNRHINEFLKQFTNEKPKTKQEILKLANAK